MEREFDSDLPIKSQHLVYFRLAFALISLTVGVFVWALAQVELNAVAFFAVGTFVVVYSCAALFLLRTGALKTTQQYHFFNTVLLVMDIAGLSTLVHYSGGVDSDFYFLYLLPILLASHIFARRGIYYVAFGAAACYIGVLLLENAQFIKYLLDPSQTEGLAGAYVKRLWVKVIAHSVILAVMAFVWATFCEHMSKVAQQRATRLRGQLDANNRLVSESKAQASREQLFNLISSAIRSTLELDQILRTTVSQISSALNISRCAILTPSSVPCEPPLIWEALHSGQDHSGHQQTLFSPRFCEFILAHKAKYEEVDGDQVVKTFVFNEPAKDAFFADIKEDVQKLGFESLVVQPIMYGMESKGVLLIGECDVQRAWTASELELIKSVGGQVAIAIEHANLVDQLSRKNRDLLQKNQTLDHANFEMRTMQSHLVHQEKMASLGRMVAGIAHELNNPVNFVHGNLPYLREYFQDLKRVIAMTDQLPKESRDEIDALKKEVRYDFLITDLDNIIADLEEGAERIRGIIRNLRSFSRLDEAELKEASLQEGIESTLKILNQYYGRDKIPVQTDFADIPLITCYPGKLNQVWMNLLSNAAEALSKLEDPTVSIKTALDGDDWVIVSISDNGSGIKDQDQSKIFEPFYTTKPIGQGTGLGLSICHSIIERHGGRIWFETPESGGTTFKVRIPLKAEPVEADEEMEKAVVGE